jgi:hypothetical protein
VTETEQSFAAPPGSVLRQEPFRLFYPLGTLLAWVDVGHRLLYGIGATETDSCLAHGIVQVEGSCSRSCSASC